jgi:nitroreductase
MEKPAEADYPILEILKRRWSPRVFSDRFVEAEKLKSLFEAARWAPSSFNEQPWSFVLATKEQPAEFAGLLSCLVEGNQKWARTAPVLIVSVAKLNFTHTGKPNRHAFHDVGLAVGQLLVQATALDLFVHQMAGFSPERVAELYQIPAEFAPVSAIAIGYGAATEDLPEPSRQSESAPRSRKPVKSFVFAGQWGEPADIVAS